MKWLMKMGHLIKWNLIKEKEREGFPLKGDDTGGLRKCWGMFRKSSTFHVFSCEQKSVCKILKYSPKL
jgi:hypothetical protein